MRRCTPSTRYSAPWTDGKKVAIDIPVFAVSAASIERIKTDSIGSGQRFAIATIEICTRLLARDNEVATHWAPAHHGVPGNEEADDEFAKAAAEGEEPDSAVPGEYR